MSESVTLGDLLREYEGDLEVLPAGDYEAEITNVKPRDTDIAVTYRVTVGPYAGKKFMAGFISWKGNAVARSFTRMREVGLDKAFFQSIGAEQLPIKQVMDLVAQALKGRVIRITVGVEEPNQYHEDYRNKLEKFGGVISAPAIQLQPGIPQTPSSFAAPTGPPVPPIAAVAAPVTATAPIVVPTVAQVIPAAPPAPVAAPQPVTAVPGIATPASPAAPVAPPQPVVIPPVTQVEIPVPPVVQAPAPTPAPVADAAGVQPRSVTVTDEPDF